MIPETVTLTGRRNAPFVEEYEFADEGGQPLDFTDCSVAMQLRLYAGASGSPLISLTDTDGTDGRAYFNDPTDGVLSVTIAEASLNALPARASTDTRESFYYDLLITWPDGLTECLMEGQFILKAGVTR